MRNVCQYFINEHMHSGLEHSVAKTAIAVARKVTKRSKLLGRFTPSSEWLSTERLRGDYRLRALKSASSFCGSFCPGADSKPLFKSK